MIDLLIFFIIYVEGKRETKRISFSQVYFLKKRKLFTFLILFYLCSTKSQEQLPRGTLHCKVIIRQQ